MCQQAHKVQPLVGNTKEFLDMTLKWVLDTADTDVQRLSALKLVASIVNRHADGALYITVICITLELMDY